MRVKSNLKINFLNNFKRIITAEDDAKVIKSKSIFKNYKTWIMLFLGLSLFGFLISQISIKEFLQEFTNLNIFFVAAAFGSGVAATIFRTARFEYFFPAPGRRLILFGAFAFLRVLYYILPFNSGEVVYLSVLKKYKFSPTITETAPTWFFLRLTDVIALTLWIIIILFVMPINSTLFTNMFALRWIIIALSFGLIIFILSYPFWIPRIPVSKSENRFWQYLQKFLSGFNRTFGFKTFAKTISYSVVIWCFLILFDTFTLYAFDVPLSFAECFLASVAVYCVSLLPINTPLNLGTGDALWTGILMLSGIDSVQAVSIALSIRFANILVLLIEGTIGGSLLFVKQEPKTSLKFP